MNKKIPKKILEIRNLSKYFVSKFGVNRAVDNVSFDLHEGEIIGLIGQSGSGKTTIGKTLIRIYNEANGIVALDGTIISGRKITKSANKKLKKNVQMIFQDAHSALNEKRNVYSTLEEALKVHKLIKKEFKEINKFSKWKNVIDTQKFTLSSKYTNTLIDYYNFRKKIVTDFYLQLKQQLEEFDVNAYATADEAANNLYSIYYNDRLHNNRKIINKLAKENSSLLDFFLNMNKSVDDLKNIDEDEVDFLAAKKELEKYKFKVKHNLNIEKIKANHKNKYDVILKDHIKETQKTIKAFMYDAKTKVKFYKQNASLAVNMNLHNEAKNNLLVSQEFLRLAKEIREHKEIHLLWTQQIFELYNELNEFSKNHIFGKDKDKFDFQKYIAMSNKNIVDQNHRNDIKVNKIKLFSEVGTVLDKAVLTKMKMKIKESLTIFHQEVAKFKKEWSQQHDKDVKSLKEIKDGVNLGDLKKAVRSLFKKTHEHLDKKLALESETAKKKLQSKKIVAKKFKILAWNIKNKELKDIHKALSDVRKKMETQNKAFDYEEKSLTRELNDINILYGLVNVSKRVRKKKVMRLLTNKKIYDMLESVGLKTEHAYRYPHEFSGGQKQRICISRALIIDPKVIIADEPTASLDVSIQAQVLNVLIDLVKNRNISMIFIGHDLSTIEYLADTIQVLHYGRVVERGSIKEIFKNPVHPYTKTLFESVPRMENANEAFKVYDSQLAYLAEYNGDILPSYFHIGKTEKHDVLGIATQIQRWENVSKK